MQFTVYLFHQVSSCQLDRSFVVKGYTKHSVHFRFSGVTEESLRGVTTTIHEVQAVLLSMIHRDTILVGHSLESDLKATKVPCTCTIVHK